MKESQFPASEQESSINQVVKDSIERELLNELSPERKKELTHELYSVTNLFEQAQVPYFIAGGSGIDLLDGEWNRDHQDLDIAILSSDKDTFFAFATAQGFRFTDADRKQLTLKDLSEPRENAFAYGEDDDGNFLQFEVMFRDDEAEFADAPSVSIEGKDIVLQPPEVISFHKIMDGRRKDLADIITLVSQLDHERLQRLNELLSSSGAKIIIGEVQIDDVQELLKQAKVASQQLSKQFFAEKPQEIVRSIEDELDEVMKALYEESDEDQSQQEYFEKLSERYGGFLPERRKIIHEIADYLFQDPKPTFEDVKKFSRTLVDINERVKQKALYEYQSQKIWKVEQL